MEKTEQAGQREFLVALGKRIREARLRLNLSQEDVCFPLGMSQHYLSQVETGHRNISVWALHRIAGVLQVQVAALLEGIE